MKRFFPWRECGWAVVFLLLLAGLYVGSYYVILDEWESERCRLSAILSRTVGGQLPLHPSPLPEPRLEARYRFGGDWVALFFAPMHGLDRIVRPGYWH
jgi:hypothetical protein